MAQWASGVSLGWAVFSLLLGVAIMAVILIKIGREFRDARRVEEREE